MASPGRSASAADERLSAPVMGAPLSLAPRSATLRAFLALCLFVALHCAAAPFPAGASERTIDVEGVPLQVYAYKPANYAGREILLVLPGLGRNAAGYRDYARPLADRYGSLVIAPLFDREHFPTWRYQQGGIARRVNGGLELQPRSQWIATTFESLVAAVRRVEEAPAMGFSVVGHSAGGQALSRYAAFGEPAARRMVIANPSTWLWPSAEAAYPFGYGGLPDALAGEVALRRYLALPVVVLLGTADVKRGPDLNVQPGAMAQGENRYERGTRFYRAAEALARSRGWPFAWRLLEVPGVGHSARGMLGSEAAERALAD